MPRQQEHHIFLLLQYMLITSGLTMSCSRCSWVEQVLQGVSELPIHNRAGSVIVFGEKSHAICTNPSGDVIIAAGEVDAGKVVVSIPFAYVKGFNDGKQEDANILKLQHNLKQWLTNGTFVEKTAIISLDQVKAKIDDTVQIIICRGVKIWPSKIETLITKFVERGGSFIYGMSPKGWHNRHSVHHLNNVSFRDLLKRAGMQLSTKLGLSKESIIPITVDHYPVIHFAHIGALIEHCKTKENMTSHGKQLAQILLDLSDDISAAMSSSLHGLHEKHLEHLENCLKKKKIKDPYHVALMHMYNTLAHMGIGFNKLPNIQDFPGDFPVDADLPLKCAELILNSRHMEAHPTGYYLPAGRIMTVNVQVAEPKSIDWYVIVGAHKDKLSKAEKLQRWPSLRCTILLDGEVNTIVSPIGGLVYFKCDGNARLEVRIDNVVEAPFYDLENTDSRQHWNCNRLNPGLWADICGKYIRFTVPSSSIQNLDDLADTLQTWDELMLGYHDLRGTDVTKQKKEWVVSDLQPSVGYMHSGYPIVTHMDVADPDDPKFMLDLKGLKQGRWGLFHELGHNMQRPMWTFKGTTEVTCNIFSLYGMQLITKLPLTSLPKIQNTTRLAKKYFESGARFNDEWLKTPVLALTVYAQLAYYFGWNTYKSVFRHYEALLPKDRPTKDQHKLDEWVLCFSQISEYDLRPLFDFWGWPLPQNVHQVLSDSKLPLFLPEDTYTQLAPDREQQILVKYPGIITRIIDGKTPMTPEVCGTEEHGHCHEEIDTESDHSAFYEIDSEIQDGGHDEF